MGSKLALLTAISFPLTFAFTVPRFPSSTLEKTKIRQSGDDYEFIAPEPSPIVYETTLSSSYPPNTPASLRGEAVRSALRSSQCIGWRFTKSSPLRYGVVRIKGKGCLTFLNNKFSSSFDEIPSFSQTCLLNPKGRVVDCIGVALVQSDEAFLVTSPGHSGKDLFNRLDPYVFPLDEIELENKSDVFIFDLVSTSLEDVDKLVRKQMEAHLGRSIDVPGSASKVFAQDGLLITPSTTLNQCAAVGYTFCFTNIIEGERVWEFLTSDQNSLGPVAIGEREFESIRIESGTCGFGKEFLAYSKESKISPPSPMEVHLETTVNDEKGCYLGQEGIASVLKNPRGPPRQLYQVVFADDFNPYEQDNQENPTRIPQPGDKLYCLGSNEEIQVGTITSVAEPGSNGEPVTLALALVKRADSVIKSMKKIDLSVPAAKVDVSESSGIIYPKPAKAPLEDLEVIIGDSFTVGTLKAIPSLRFVDQNMFIDEVPDFVKNLPDDHGGEFLMANRRQPEDVVTVAKMGDSTKRDDLEDDPDSEELNKAVEEARKEAEAAAAEAERKAAKMTMLENRAAEAMARRKASKVEADLQRKQETAKSSSGNDDEAEAQRKAEKMAMLQKRAEEAIARRKKRKEGTD